MAGTDCLLRAKIQIEVSSSNTSVGMSEVLQFIECQLQLEGTQLTVQCFSAMLAHQSLKPFFDSLSFAPCSRRLDGLYRQLSIDNHSCFLYATPPAYIFSIHIHHAPNVFFVDGARLILQSRGERQP